MANWQLLNNTFANIKRLRQIVNVFIKHGFGFMVDELGLISYLSVGKRLRLIKEDTEEAQKLNSQQRAVRAFEELGPSFIKLGQLLSTRKDLLPPLYIKEFEKLKDRVSPFSLDLAYKTIELELGKPAEKLFASFEKKPAAAASIAQVHYARLKTGEDVVIKIQRPGIEKKIKADIRIFYFLAEQIKKVFSKGLYDPVELVKEFERLIGKELDFNQEATNIEQFAKNFQDDKTVYFPKVYWEWTSQRVLVMERLFGFSPEEWDAIDNKGLDRAEIAENFYRASMKQFVEHELYHADPHSSNVIILEDGRVGIVDCGMVGQLDKEVRDSFFNVFSGFILLNMDMVLDGYISIGVLPENVDQDNFKADMLEIGERYFRDNLHQVNVMNFLDDALRAGPRHNMKIPSYFFIVIKSLALIEATAKKIYPPFSIPTASKTYIKNMMDRKSDPNLFFNNATKTFSDVYQLMKNFPPQFNRVMRRMEKGSFVIKTELVGLDEFRRDLFRITNRLFFGFIITGIIIGSSIIIQSDMGYKMFGIPFLGIFGYILANLINLWVLYTIYRSGLW